MGEPWDGFEIQLAGIGRPWAPTCNLHAIISRYTSFSRKYLSYLSTNLYRHITFDNDLNVADVVGFFVMYNVFHAFHFAFKATRRRASRLTKLAIHVLYPSPASPMSPCKLSRSRRPSPAPQKPQQPVDVTSVVARTFEGIETRRFSLCKCSRALFQASHTPACATL